MYSYDWGEETHGREGDWAWGGKLWYYEATACWHSLPHHVNQIKHIKGIAYHCPLCQPPTPPSHSQLSHRLWFVQSKAAVPCEVLHNALQCLPHCNTLTTPSQGSYKNSGDSRCIKQHITGFYAGHLIAIITSLCGNGLLSAQCYQQQYFALLCNHKLMRQHKICTLCHFIQQNMLAYN